MDDLIAFLGARLDADEQAARAATGGPWRHNPDKHWRKPGTSWFEEAVFAGPAGAEATCVAGTGETDDPQSMADARHIARWDPARVLAEVEAKRRIVDHVSRELEDLGADNPWWYSDKLNPILEALALPYADHPEYRAEWRP